MTTSQRADLARVTSRGPLVPAELDLPKPPPGKLAEFGLRYGAAQRMVQRYAYAVAAVEGHRGERARLAATWPVIADLLERIGRHCELGPRPSGRKGAKGPRATRGRSERQRRLHEVHVWLVALEQAVDKAVAIAVGVLLDLDESKLLHHRAELDEWLAAIGDILNELDARVEQY